MVYDDYRKAKMQALKDKDKVKNRVLTNLLSALTYATKDAGRALTEAECDQILNRELKKIEEALAMSESRPDKQTVLLEEKKILQAYQPAQLDDVALQSAVTRIFADAGLEKSMKSKGALMRLVMAELSGQADGKRISQMVDDTLKAQS